jgi:AcrR family transcriptional regulator
VKRSDALANRQRILEAARHTFAAQGVSADMKLIAEQAGLGVGTIYRNFPTKDDLLIELCRQLAGDVAAAFLEGEDEADPVAGIRVSVLNMYRIASGYGWLMHAKFNQQLPPEVQKHLRPPHEDPRYQAVHRMMARARANGQIREDLDTRIIVTLLFSTIWPLLHHVPTGQERTPAELADAVLDIVLNGAVRPAGIPGEPAFAGSVNSQEIPIQ